MASHSIAVLLCVTILAASVSASVSATNRKVGIYELKRDDISANFTNWGATIISLLLPDRHGKLADVVLGYDSVKDYMNDTSYVGSIVGRVANRIGDAQFKLNGTLYKLVANEEKNMLHGMWQNRFSNVVWKVKRHHNKGPSPYIIFTYRSFDGEQGFPVDLLVTVTYSLIGDKQLSVSMKAIALNKPTPVSLAQHIYWNIGGHNSGDILSNEILIFGSHFTPVDSYHIPTGEIASVKGTPYDFLKPHAVGRKIHMLDHGYDINYALDGDSGVKLMPAALVYDKKSGRVLQLWTNAPGMQFYTSNFLKDVKGKGGFVYQPHAALCLETQGFPDAVNHPKFPSTIVSPGKPYSHQMLFKFSTKSPSA
ncbi:uncharacterized protein LOC107415531 [Ziziphus jujuba]|uniref:Aldose 1-epimerase n=1 Tax=Ziziphus jujuba TaxID=326968 RepID=A0ABM4A814_ZIZJJ|nr:uncharacterized protein LOC107415531 [Ziziphus jujuba]